MPRSAAAVGRVDAPTPDSDRPGSRDATPEPRTAREGVRHREPRRPVIAMRLPFLSDHARKIRRVKTPTVLQMEAVECGAAALGIVLGYYGRFVSLEELRVACGVSRDGTKASNILKGARSYGLKCKGLSQQPDDLLALRLPLIVFWNFNHFVVVEGFAPGQVFLNDPATGPRVVSEAEFGESFTGVVLTLEPEPDFRPGGARRGLIGPLRNRLRGSGAGLLYVLLASLILVVAGLFPPVLTRVFVDEYLVSGRRSWVGPLLIGMAVAAVLRAALTWLQRRALTGLETKLALVSSYRYFEHVLRLPIEFFTQRYGGEIGTRVEINDRLARLLSGELTANLMNLVVVAACVGLMFSYDVLLTLVGLAFAAVNFLALQAVSRSRKDINMRLLQERGKLLGTSMAGLQTIETLKATGAESDFFGRWSGQMAKVLESSQRMEVSSLWLGLVPSLLTALNTVAILGVGAVRVMDGHMTVGMLVAFQSLTVSLMGPVEQFLWMGSTLQEVEGEMGRLDDVLRHPIDPTFQRPGPDGPAVETLPRLTGRLEIRAVTFGYSRLDPPLISGFSLEIRPGSRVALVGPSGSGKSTVAKLACGLSRPWSGEVLLDGLPLNRIPRDVLANSLSMVDQEFFLVEGPVRDVLTLWDPTVSEEALARAARDACIHDDIAARPGGYDSRVEEAGSNFSGGQRQRLEIARALVNNPSLVVLDEATSALDPVTEKRIDDNLRQRGCSCLIVAHRLSTIRDCDEIIVLSEGRIVQRGTHDALYSTRGLYRRLIRSS